MKKLLEMFQERKFRFLVNFVCAVVIFVLGLILMSSPEFQGLDVATVYICFIFYAVSAIFIYMIFDCRHYPNPRKPGNWFTKGVSAIVYLILWLVLLFFVLMSGLLNAGVLWELSKPFSAFVAIGLSSMTVAAYFAESVLDSCIYTDKKEKFEKGKIVAPFAFLIGFLASFLVIGLLGMIEAEVIRQFVTLAPSLIALGLFVKKFITIRKREKKVPKEGSSSGSRSSSSSSSSSSSGGYVSQNNGSKVRTEKGKAYINDALSNIASSYKRYADDIGGAVTCNVDVEMKLDTFYSSIKAIINLEFKVDMPYGFGSDYQAKQFAIDNQNVINDCIRSYKDEVAKEIADDIDSALRNLRADYDADELNKSYRISVEVHASNA